jgi:hypothetical protein
MFKKKMFKKKNLTFAVILLFATLLLSSGDANAIWHSDGSSPAWPADADPDATPPVPAGCNWGMCDHSVTSENDLGTGYDCWTAVGVQGLYDPTCPPAQFCTVNWWHEAAAGGYYYPCVWWFYCAMQSTYTINYTYTQYHICNDYPTYQTGFGGYSGYMRRDDFNTTTVLNDVTAASGYTADSWIDPVTYTYYMSESWTPSVYAWQA